jgi:Tfp pilus assembly protein PilN
MFTIDLLRGEGIPAKSRPAGVAVAVTTFVVPIVAAIVMFSFYLTNRVAISIKKQKIATYETKIGELFHSVRNQKASGQQAEHIGDCLSEVAAALDRHTQWSPVLVTVAESIPDLVVLTRIEVKQQFIHEEVPGEQTDETVEVSVPVRTLRMTVCGSPGSACDQAVRDFRDRLRASSVLGPRLENIKVSQEFDLLGNKEVVSYDIDCIFKPGA